MGLQYGVPRLSPFLRPQALPVLTSFQSSLNHRFRALPFSVLRTATSFLLSALGYSTRGVRRRKDFIRCLHLAVTVVFDRTALLKRYGLHFAHASAFHHSVTLLAHLANFTATSHAVTTNFAAFFKAFSLFTTYFYSCVRVI